MRRLMLILLLCGAAAWAQNSSAPASKTPASDNSQDSGSKATKNFPAVPANQAPPRSDSVNASGIEEGESSSKDTQIDLSPPPDDAKDHPQSEQAVADEDALNDEGSGATDPNAFKYWDPHKAAKDVEVGDFYFKRKNYAAAESRYREALQYKDNDAIATFRLAQCLEKMDRPEAARTEYESYLKILPYGPEAESAHKAIDRLKGPATSDKPAK